MNPLTAVVVSLLLQNPAPQEAPKQAEPAKQPETLKVITVNKSSLVFYGFLRLDVLYDTSRPNNVQVPSFILSPDTPPGGENDLSIHPRLTRFGMDFDGPNVEALGNAKVTGKLEIDFYNLLPGTNVITSNSREFIRMRHAWLKLGWENFSIQAGQRDDVIAPLIPTPNNDLVMWNAGNLADRRPQIRGEYKSGGFTGTAMVGLTGAVDGNDLDGNGYLDGESSGLPTMQARFGYELDSPWVEKTRVNVGVWAHYAREDPDNDVAGEDAFTSNGFGLDLTLPLYDKLMLKLEWWTGKNLDDVRGGIAQGVVAGEEVSATGGWAEISYKATDYWTPVLGVYMDDPDDEDLAAGGRDLNFIIALSNRFRFGPVELGLDWLHWTTEFVGNLDDGVDNRFNLFAAYHF